MLPLNSKQAVLSWVFLSLSEEIVSTGPMGLKTLTHWILNYIYIDLFHSSL